MRITKISSNIKRIWVRFYSVILDVKDMIPVFCFIVFIFSLQSTLLVAIKITGIIFLSVMCICIIAEFLKPIETYLNIISKQIDKFRKSLIKNAKKK